MKRLMQAVTAAQVVIALFIFTLSVARAGETTQIDRGATTYRFYCSACHGDVGQGLTDEWRSTWDPKDQNCWQSKCHALNHPPEGFIFPKQVPAIVGPGTLTRFSTALQLQTFLQSAMPFYKPGLLSTAQYWDVTAFLLDRHGIAVPTDLNPGNAGAIRLHPADTPDAGVLVVGAALGFGIVAGVVIWRRAAAKRRAP